MALRTEFVTTQMPKAKEMVGDDAVDSSQVTVSGHCQWRATVRVVEGYITVVIQSSEDESHTHVTFVPDWRQGSRGHICESGGQMSEKRGEQSRM